MTNTQCIVEGCEEVVYAKCLCHFHYNRQINGKPLTDPKVVHVPQGTKCVVENCHEKPCAKQLCPFHYERQQRGKLLDSPKRQLQGSKCLVENCCEKPVAKQLCPFHYQRRRKGLPLEAPKMLQPAGSECAAPGCAEKPIAKNLCPRHYAEWKRGKEFSSHPKRRGNRIEIVCLRCETPKPAGEFPSKGVICLECQSNDHKARYRANPAKYKENNKANRIRIAQLVDELKTHPCTDCGQQYEPFCMDFDHIGSKTAAISLMVHNTWGIERIMKEMEQTELVCILCHKTRTHLRNQEIWQDQHPTKTRVRNQEILLAHKDKPCAICGERRPHWQMEFDHILGEKRESVSVMVARRYSTEAVLTEIAKCQVVCALCHRRKTFAEGGYKNY